MTWALFTFDSWTDTLKRHAKVINYFIVLIITVGYYIKAVTESYKFIVAGACVSRDCMRCVDPPMHEFPLFC